MLSAYYEKHHKGILCQVISHPHIFRGGQYNEAIYRPESSFTYKHSHHAPHTHIHNNFHPACGADLPVEVLGFAHGIQFFFYRSIHILISSS